MDGNSLVRSYIPMAKFIAQIMGNQCEVVLHDLTNPEHSIIAIENNYISGRKVGDAPTNLVLKIWKKKSYLDKEFLANYKAIGRDNKVFRSSSFFIKDETGELKGMLCINVDIDHYVRLKERLESLMEFTTDLDEPEENVSETLNGNLEDVLSTLITQAIQKHNVAAERMSTTEKIEVVRDLYEQGAFMIKGGVSAVAKRLHSSEPTIYRYLNNIK
ncbi:MAG: transcriptional regulator [Bacillaceae bacterium]